MARLPVINNKLVESSGVTPSRGAMLGHTSVGKRPGGLQIACRCIVRPGRGRVKQAGAL